MFVDNYRGAVLESRHTVHLAVVDADGHLVARAGDPGFVTFMRSAAKPFQAMPLVADGAADRFGLTTEELALACASHSSEPEQVERVRGLLAKIGCAESDLRCGPHPPLSETVAEDYRARGVRLTAVHSNCSGKHAGMLALASHHGWPTDGYERPEHPVQQRLLQEVSAWTGEPVERIGTGVDGCGVVCYAVPLRSMARGYARLGSGERGAVLDGVIPAAQRQVGHSTEGYRSPSGDRSPLPDAAGRVVGAMLRHPDLVAGSGRPCTEIMRAHPERVVTKVGAEGVYCALLTEAGLGVALKVEDGNGPAAAVAMANVLAELGLDEMPHTLLVRPTHNTRGERVGELRVNGGVER